MVILNNNSLYVEISEIGAEIRKAAVDGEDRLWSGDPKWWEGVAPVLFPICSGIPDEKFTFESKEYSLKKHGFSRDALFEVEESSPTQATFLLRDNEETLKRYPWHFELRVKYTITGNSIKVDYDVKNTDSKTMYYSIGAHEAYDCKEGIEDYDIIFEKPETLYHYELEGDLLSYNKIPMLKDSRVFPLYEKYFEVDALVFKDVKSRYVTLRNRKTGKEASVKFEGFDYLLFWHHYKSPYICIEPWAGMSSSVDSSYEIAEKEGIRKLEAGKNEVLTHTIYF